MYRPSIVQAIIRIAVLFCLCLGYTACGQKGDLYLPEKASDDTAYADQQSR